MELTKKQIEKLKKLQNETVDEVLKDSIAEKIKILESNNDILK